MSRWVLVLRNIKDNLESIDYWVYHNSFETREEANEKGIEFCKMHEEELINNNLECEYDVQSLFVKDNESDNWLFVCSYDVYPIDFPLDEQPEV